MINTKFRIVAPLGPEKNDTRDLHSIADVFLTVVGTQTFKYYSHTRYTYISWSVMRRDHPLRAFLTPDLLPPLATMQPWSFLSGWLPATPSANQQISTRDTQTTGRSQAAEDSPSLNPGVHLQLSQVLPTVLHGVVFWQQLHSFPLPSHQQGDCHWYATAMKLLSKHVSQWRVITKCLQQGQCPCTGRQTSVSSMAC